MIRSKFILALIPAILAAGSAHGEPDSQAKPYPQGGYVFLRFSLNQDEVDSRSLQPQNQQALADFETAVGDESISTIARRLDDLSFGFEDGKAMEFYFSLKGGMWGQRPLDVLTDSLSRDASKSVRHVRVLFALARTLAKDRYLAIGFSTIWDAFLGSQPSSSLWKYMYFISARRLISLADVETYVRARAGFSSLSSSQEFIDKVVADYIALEDRAPRYSYIRKFCARLLTAPTPQRAIMLRRAPKKETGT